jgi:UDP-galactopyranose mutase
MRTDWLIVGAGFTGAVLAERIAAHLGRSVLVVDRRDHIGGNAYDYYDEHGVLVHKYGPHIFHTNSEKVWRYLSRFTEWRPYYHRVRAYIEGQLVPVPFNLTALHALFPRRSAERIEDALVESFGHGARVPILRLKESNRPELNELADYVYRYVYEGYTIKQWGLKPEELSPSVTGRVPVAVSVDDRYFTDTYQAMPLHGYTAMFRRMLAHPKIKIMLQTDYRDIAREIQWERMVYTGPIDEFFDCEHGRLPYRSLSFEMRYYGEAPHQPVAQVNYPSEYAFTRISEFKHMTGQNGCGTTVAVEYPERHEPGHNDPYYPIPRDENRELYNAYAALARRFDGKVLFAGRLGEYKYFNMDQAVAAALALFEKEIVR